jgi:hypothetical protein
MLDSCHGELLKEGRTELRLRFREKQYSKPLWQSFENGPELSDYMKSTLPVVASEFRYAEQDRCQRGVGAVDGTPRSLRIDHHLSTVFDPYGSR